MSDTNNNLDVRANEPVPTPIVPTVPTVSKKMITLPSGKTAEIAPFKGKHIREAQKMSDGDEGKLMFALIAMLVTIDGTPIVLEDLDEMNGPDVLKLMGEFSDANF